MKPLLNSPSSNSYCGPRVCEECGTDFITTKPTQRFCRPQCKGKWQRRTAQPPPFVGSYDLLPEHLKKNFTPGPRDECWIYASRSTNGYAQNTSVKSFKANAYRLIYMMMIGPVPDGLELDHTCDNGAGGCVNPYHLVPTTHRVNTVRTTRTKAGQHARKTHCPKGHPYDEENTMYQRREGRGERHCRTCKNARTKAWAEKKGKEALNAHRRAQYAANRDKILAQRQAARERRRAS